MLSLILAALWMDPVGTTVSVPSRPAPLYGTMLAPEGQTQAAALILPGSGPTDRDGNSPMGVSAAPYRLLAEGLAERGIATVRIDKRTIGQSAPAATSEEELTFQTFIDDARAWAAVAARQTGQPCVWLIGHSEGSLVALGAVQGGNDAVCGLILLSGAGLPAGMVLREQFEAGLPEDLKGPAMTTLTELEAGRTVAAPPPALAAVFRPSVQPYIISWLALDPAEMIRGYDGPVMIAQGTTDIQIAMTNADALAAAQPTARLVVWEGVNHVLKVAPLDRAANAATYNDPTLPLAPGVVDDVAGFILRSR